MDTITDCLIPISIPITATDRLRVSSLAQQLSTPELQEQVCRNALAVLATHRYLQLLAIASDLSASNSWNPASHHPGNIADLYILEKDKRLECRCIHRGDPKCFIPEEVWGDRLGYVVVQLDEPYREGIVLGFVPKVSVTELPLSYLQPLDALIDCLTVEMVEVNLSKWFQNVFEAGWQSLEEYLGTHSRDLSPNFRAVPNFRNDFEESSIKRIKLIDLGVQLERQSLTMLVGLKPEADNKVGIRVQLRPPRGETNLPPNLKLTLLSPSGETIQEVRSRNQDNYIQLKRWKSRLGARFRIQIALNDLSLTEDFVV